MVEMREQCGLNLGHKGNGVKYDSKVWNMIERSSLEKWYMLATKLMRQRFQEKNFRIQKDNLFLGIKMKLITDLDYGE